MSALPTDTFVDAIAALNEHNYVVVVLERLRCRVLYVTVNSIDGENLFGFTDLPQFAARLNRARATELYHTVKTGDSKLQFGALLQMLPGATIVVDRWGE